MEMIVNIPEGIDVRIENFRVSVSGKNGKLEKDFFTPLFQDLIKIERLNGSIKISSISDKRKVKSEIGTMAAHIRNMIKGVTEEYVYKLKIIYMHFPITVKISGKEVTISNFLGEKSPRKANIVGDSKVEINGDMITVKGINKEYVGQTAANIERATKIKARDRRVFMDGIFMLRRE